MDYANIYRFTLFMVLMKLMESGRNSSNTGSDWSSAAVDKASNDVQKSSRDTYDSFVSAYEDNEDEGGCCFNGGTCVLNSFCHCLKNYYGRYCEHIVKHRQCGSIIHGTWMLSGCHLCHCFDGQMRCKLTKMKGCDKLSYIEGIEKDPDYLIGIDQKTKDYDMFYYYDTPEVTSGVSMVTTRVLVCIATGFAAIGLVS